MTQGYQAQPRLLNPILTFSITVLADPQPHLAPKTQIGYQPTSPLCFTKGQFYLCMIISIILHRLVMSFNQLLNVFPCRQVISSSVTNSSQDILSGPCPSRPYSNLRGDCPVSQLKTNLIAAICHTQNMYHTWPVSILITAKSYQILEILPSAFPFLLGG